jgi:hypothetical protein
MRSLYPHINHWSVSLPDSGIPNHEQENRMQRVLRWDVPVDSEWHNIGAGPVVLVAAREYRERPGDLVEVWTLEDTAPDGVKFDDLRKRSVIVAGTGQPVPFDNVEHLGSTEVPSFNVISGPTRGTVDRVESMAGLVWHVFGRYSPEATRRADLAPTVAGKTTKGRTREALVRTVEDEATSLAYWLANELGEHVDDQDGETLTQTVQRLVAVKLAPADAPAVPITDWPDFRVGDVVVQTPDLSAPGSPEFAADLLVRRPGGAS